MKCLRAVDWLSSDAVISEVNVSLATGLSWEIRCCNSLGYSLKRFGLDCLRESWRELGRRPPTLWFALGGSGVATGMESINIEKCLVHLVILIAFFRKVFHLDTLSYDDVC